MQCGHHKIKAQEGKANRLLACGSSTLSMAAQSGQFGCHHLVCGTVLLALLAARHFELAAPKNAATGATPPPLGPRRAT
jgi:hypothetical protein